MWDDTSHQLFPADPWLLDSHNCTILHSWSKPISCIGLHFDRNYIPVKLHDCILLSVLVQTVTTWQNIQNCYKKTCPGHRDRLTRWAHYEHWHSWSTQDEVKDWKLGPCFKLWHSNCIVKHRQCSSIVGESSPLMLLLWNDSQCVCVCNLRHVWVTPLNPVSCRLPSRDEGEPGYKGRTSHVSD